MARTKDGKIDLRAPLEVCPFKNLHRQVGVLVSEPFYHRGWEVMTVDVDVEVPVVNTSSSGGVAKMEDADQETMNGLLRCRAACLEIRREMGVHIARLEDLIQGRAQEGED